MINRYSHDLIIQIRSINLKNLFSFHLKRRDWNASQIMHEVLILEELREQFYVLASAGLAFQRNVL